MGEDTMYKQPIEKPKESLQTLEEAKRVLDELNERIKQAPSPSQSRLNKKEVQDLIRATAALAVMASEGKSVKNELGAALGMVAFQAPVIKETIESMEKKGLQVIKNVVGPDYDVGFDLGKLEVSVRRTSPTTKEGTNVSQTIRLNKDGKVEYSVTRSTGSLSYGLQFGASRGSITGGVTGTLRFGGKNEIVRDVSISRELYDTLWPKEVDDQNRGSINKYNLEDVTAKMKEVGVDEKDIEEVRTLVARFDLRVRVSDKLAKNIVETERVEK